MSWEDFAPSLPGFIIHPGLKTKCQTIRSLSSVEHFPCTNFCPRFFRPCHLGDRFRYVGSGSGSRNFYSYELGWIGRERMGSGVRNQIEVKLAQVGKTLADRPDSLHRLEELIRCSLLQSEQRALYVSFPAPRPRTLAMPGSAHSMPSCKLSRAPRSPASARFVSAWPHLTASDYSNCDCVRLAALRARLAADGWKTLGLH